MKCVKKYSIYCTAAVLMLSMLGYQSSDDAEAPSSSPSEAIVASLPAAPSATIPSSDVITLDSAVDWDTTEYENDYLKFQIPANWKENLDYSDNTQLLSFFVSSEATSDMSSNVNIQITNTKNQSKDMDYGDPEIQNEFHEFLISNAGLPSEAKDGAFTVYQTPEFYVYSISFLRQTDDETIVKQTAYLPVGLDYSIMVWATDWNDGTTPSVDEIAMHLCATLELKDIPIK